MTLELRVHPKNPRARERWLTGDDDGGWEVKVPLRIKTEEQAEEWLRPPEAINAVRQGEFFFNPMATGWKPSSLAGEEWTEAGSWRTVTVRPGPSGIGRHEITLGPLPEGRAVSRVVQTEGSTAFRARRGVKFHAWRSRPQLYVRGAIEHPEHRTLVLGSNWHEVIPNRAHGPWEVRENWAGAD